MIRAMQDSLWRRFRRWRAERAERAVENAAARAEAERKLYESRTQARRLQGSGRPTGYDKGRTADKF